MLYAMRLWRICLKIMVLVAVFVAWRPAWAAKNVIIMISDGAGCNTWLATSMYQGKVGKQVYDGPNWVNYLVSTYPLNTSIYPTNKNQQDSLLVYDPAKYWDCKAPAASGWKILLPFGGYAFARYDFATAGYTDSAAAATALATGVKTYNNAINWTNDNKSMQGQTIAEIAKSKGKAVGVVTTVPWSHATPAGLGGAHNAKRDAYAEIANEMLNATWLDVIMGAGHPRFDDNGRPLTKETSNKQCKFVGGKKTWNLLASGTHPAGWKLVQTKAEFEDLVKAPSPPKKILGTAQVANTLQYNRGRSTQSSGTKTSTQETSGLAAVPGGPSRPFENSPNSNVPSLATMSLAAIHCLESHPNGFYLMIEGGAVDWANHGNDPGRMIEEQVDFIAAVDAVVHWIESHDGWDNTLLVLTADHETGMLWGPESDKVPFQPLVDHGPGKLPGMMYHSKTHSNSLVPVYARGAGSSRFADHIRGTDKTAAKVWSISGDYVDNTDIFTVLKAAVIEADDLWKTHEESVSSPDGQR